MTRHLVSGSTLALLLILSACSTGPTAPSTPAKPSFHFVPQQECTVTLGFWKNHKAAFLARTPNDGLNIGNHRYTETQLLSILKNVPAGNGLIQLARQLITAKLNGGQFDPNIKDVVAAADALIGDKIVPPVGTGFLKPSKASSLIDQLDNFNEGKLGTPHCGD
jgi:hypothetical protein